MYEDDEISTFHVLYDDSDIKVVIETAPSFLDGVFVHTNVKEFNLSRYKKYKSLWKDIVAYLGEIGVDNIYALPTDDKAEKWETKFSFVDTRVTYEGSKIMKYVGENHG